ncbi:hypothetical protein Hanom_Chr07g00616601 [Helianthus anomalus]
MVSPFLEDVGMPMKTVPPPATAFVLTFRPSVSDEGLWFRRRWMVAMVADLWVSSNWVVKWRFLPAGILGESGVL